MTFDLPVDSVKAFSGTASALDLAQFLAEPSHDIEAVEVLKGALESVVLVYYRFNERQPVLRLLEGGCTTS